MKETTFESRAKEAFGDVYGKIKELEEKARQLRTELDNKIQQPGGPDGQQHDAYEDIKYASKAAIHDIRQGVEQASSAMSEAIKKASHHFR